MDKPLAIDLFCGLGGWTCGLLDAGFRLIGFDIERWPEYPGELVIQDVLTLHGSQFREAALIVASPPCQAYSYRAMPWKRAKALPPPDNTLFEACFRIQREASEAAGHHIPLIVENVCGAQKWVGRAKWHYGSYYLWGDVPALMPPVTFAQKFNPDGTNNPQGSWFKIADSKDRGCRKFPAHCGPWLWKNRDVPRLNDGQNLTAEAFHLKLDVKQHGSGEIWFDTGIANLPSKSARRKTASAEIARIPYPLARWIGEVYVRDCTCGSCGASGLGSR